VSSLNFFLTMSSSKVGGDVGNIRSAINENNLNNYLASHVSEVVTPVAIKQFQYGQSNPTYFLTDAQ